MQVGFWFDASACVGCMACVAACKDVHNLPIGVSLRHVRHFERGGWQRAGSLAVPKGISAHTISLSCNHCSNPACVAACPRQAMRKDAGTGVVWVDGDCCIGCGACAKACPYGAPQIASRMESVSFEESSTRARKYAVKCDACQTLPEGPACIAACTMRCLEFADIADLRARHGSIAEGDELPSATITDPNLVYHAARTHGFTE
ncbi:MAG: 4Fe-4S dicluster domain-containing protein [Eggerthellaceae bacterium]|jgi:anaerobic dimethyl sulfoxide reductase subunit B (iron-sulfur subunit)